MAFVRKLQLNTIETTQLLAIKVLQINHRKASKVVQLNGRNFKTYDK